MKPDLVKLVRSIAEEFPSELRDWQREDVERVAFNLSLLPDRVRSVCDVGGGIRLFSLAATCTGRAVYVIDDFGDPIIAEFSEPLLSLARRFGVHLIQRDVPAVGIGLAEKVDAITFFETLEHWHNSPRLALHEAVKSLTPSGLLIVSLPNCVDLHKRIATLLGTARWSSFESWYCQESFRGHVREAAVADLRAIAEDLNLSSYRLFGRNWAIRLRFGRVADCLIRQVVSLSSSLYLVGSI
jgi:SAM-dependent methyltransferase